MNLHEYQAKQILSGYGLPVPPHVVISDISDVEKIKFSLGDNGWVVKAQVHAGGRGKAGGVKLCDTEDEVKEAVNALLGKRLVTYQTDASGQPINQLLVEAKTSIQTELYLGAVIDRSRQRIVFMASTEGGMEIEKVAHDTPEKILTVEIDPVVGAQAYQARDLGYQLGFNQQQIKQLTQIYLALAALFQEKDLALLEINPLVITESSDLCCLDAKMNVDSNASYRQKEIVDSYDVTQDDERERLAAQWDLSYVALEGNIGCMVNGAGLAMATMDIIKLYGGEPANFLDVGGSATKERVAEAFKIILADQNVKAVLINIFGGIVRCDLIADGIIAAITEQAVQVPVVVRLEGNNAELGASKLDATDLNIIAASSLANAAQKVVDTVKI